MALSRSLMTHQERLTRQLRNEEQITSKLFGAEILPAFVQPRRLSRLIESLFLSRRNAHHDLDWEAHPYRINLNNVPLGWSLTR
jgi:hypothetical protein